MNMTYMTDENGEQILDENGNPIPEGGTSSISYGDWEYIPIIYLPRKKSIF